MYLQFDCDTFALYIKCLFLGKLLPWQGSIKRLQLLFQHDVHAEHAALIRRVDGMRIGCRTIYVDNVCLL